MRCLSSLGLLLALADCASHRKPLLISSSKFLQHVPPSYHPECPARSQVLHESATRLQEQELVRLHRPSAESCDDRLAEAEAVIRSVHDEEYVNDIRTLCDRGVRRASPWYTLILFVD